MENINNGNGDYSIKIQSQYCDSGFRCVCECFHYGRFKYYNSDGSPMQIEVPADKYGDAVREMEKSIERGEIKGAERAEDVIRRGILTYEQAKIIAKSEKIDAIKYDEINNMVTCTYSGGLSAAAIFAITSFDGKSSIEALKNAIKCTLRNDEESFAKSILAERINKSGLNAAINPSTENTSRFPKIHRLWQNLGNRLGIRDRRSNIDPFDEIYSHINMSTFTFLAAKAPVCAFFTIPLYLANEDINLIEFIIFVLIYLIDVANLIRKRISIPQFFKNIISSTLGIVFVVIGSIASIPLFLKFSQTSFADYRDLLAMAVLFVIGILILYFLKFTDPLWSGFFCNDNAKMLKIMKEEFNKVAFDYLLSEAEANEVIELLKANLKDDTAMFAIIRDEYKLRDMYASKDSNQFARTWLEDYAEAVIQRRPEIRVKGLIRAKGQEPV